MQLSDILLIGISSPSGGGKTTVTRKVQELLPDSVGIFFDDYDLDTIRPGGFRQWLEEGANYNDWKTPRLTNDLGKLKSGKAIVSSVDGLTLKPRKYIIFDGPLGRAHAETAGLIDFMVFIDTPLDVAMTRRMMRDLPSLSGENSSSPADYLRGQLSAYLDYGRQACLEMEKQIKPTCDLILDGCLPADELAKAIVGIIKSGPIPRIEK